MSQAPAEALLAHLDWVEGAWLGFVFADDLQAVSTLQSQVVGPQRVVQPRTPQDLRQALTRLFEAPQAPLVWLMAWHAEPTTEPGQPAGPWTEAVDWLLMRANERRQSLLGAVGGGLLLVLPRSAKARVREAAPDLWSVRALVLELSPTPLIEPRVPTGREGRIAAVVRRAEFHERMRDQPWFALVQSDEPTSLATLQSLTGGGIDWQGIPTDLAQVATLCDGSLSRNVVCIGSAAQIAALPEGVHEAAAFHADLDHPESSVTLVAPWEPLGEAPSPIEALDRLVATASAVWEQGWAAETYEVADQLVREARRLQACVDVDRRHASGLELRARAARLQGDLSGALADVDAAVRLRERLAGLHGDDGAQRRSELARALSLRGQLHLDRSDRPQATRDLSAALEHRVALATWSDDAESLSELALSWSLLGDLALAEEPPSIQGLAQAESHTREALRLRRRLAEETGAVRHRRQHGIAWGRLGRVLQRQLRMREAADAHQRAVEIATALAVADPSNMTFRMEESVARTQLAAAAWARGDAESARAEVQRAVALRRALLDEDPTNAKWAERLAVVLGQLADMALHDQDLPTALAAAEEAVEHSGSLSPGSPSQLRGQALAYLRLGDVHSASGSAVEAAACWQRVRAMLPVLLQRSPTRGEAVQHALALRLGTPS